MSSRTWRAGVRGWQERRLAACGEHLEWDGRPPPVAEQCAQPQVVKLGGEWILLASRDGVLVGHHPLSHRLLAQAKERNRTNSGGGRAGNVRGGVEDGREGTIDLLQGEALAGRCKTLTLLLTNILFYLAAAQNRPVSGGALALQGRRRHAGRAKPLPSCKSDPRSRHSNPPRTPSSKTHPPPPSLARRHNSPLGAFHKSDLHRLHPQPPISSSSSPGSIPDRAWGVVGRALAGQYAAAWFDASQPWALRCRNNSLDSSRC